MLRPTPLRIPMVRFASNTPSAASGTAPKKQSLRSMVRKTMMNRDTLSVFFGHLWPKDRFDLKVRYKYLLLIFFFSLFFSFLLICSPGLRLQ